MPALRILIVDDHSVVRAGLRSLIEHEHGLEVAGEADSISEAVFAARASKPDVILLDVKMHGESGLDAIPNLLDEHPETRVVVLSMHDEPGYIRQAFGAGASGYIVKEAADAEVVDAIKAVAAGGQYLHPALAPRLLAADAAEKRRHDDDPLTEREHEILGLLVTGHTNAEIAGKLYISVRTAETHRAHVMRKLGITTRADLVRYAIDNHLLDVTGQSSPG